MSRRRRVVPLRRSAEAGGHPVEGADEAQILGEFSPAERADLAGMLERFVGALDRVSARLG